MAMQQSCKFIMIGTRNFVINEQEVENSRWVLCGTGAGILFRSESGSARVWREELPGVE